MSGILVVIGLVCVYLIYVFYRRTTRSQQLELMLEWAEFSAYDRQLVRERHFSTHADELSGLHKRAVRLALRGGCYGFKECGLIFERFLTKLEHGDTVLAQGQELSSFMEEVRKKALRAKEANNTGLYERLLLWRAEVSQWADIASHNAARLVHAGAASAAHT